MEIELKMSNGEYLTHEDLEKYLNEYEDFYKTKIDEGILEYEWKELVKEHNDIIEQKINSFETIELLVSDVEKLINYNPCGVKGLIKPRFKLLRGEEIGMWSPLNDYKNIVYLIKFEPIKIKIHGDVPYKPKNKKFNFSVPIVSFFKLTTELPLNLKKGTKYSLGLNIVRRIYLSHMESGLEVNEELIQLDYIEKVNLHPPHPTVQENLKSKNDTPQTNSNCFVVTTTMGDVNHPVVIDFRKYRDEVLLETNLGRLFIKVYYKIGPFLSEIIKRNKTLFQISRNLILKVHKRISKR